MDDQRAGEAPDPFRRLTEAEIRELIEHNMRAGVSVGVNWEEHDMTVTEIHWRPGDPNALAQAIINNVKDEEITLDLDGHVFKVRQVS